MTDPRRSHDPLLPVALAVFVALAGVVDAAGPEEATPPVAVFAELDGTWEGTFTGFDAAGRELYRLEVRQTYTTVDALTQRVEVEDRFADGTVVTGRGTNTARRRAAGGLELACTVVKSNGERVEHRGERVRGPDGSEQILWLTDRPDRQEIFRERVVREGGETFYLIDGTGRYGDTLVLMAGRYRKQ